MKIKVPLVIILIIILFWAPTLNSNEIKWEEYVDFSMFVGDLYEEDYSRNNPPYNKHVTMNFVFANITSNRRITGIEFKARFYDQFDDLVYESEEIKSNINLSPGENNLIDSYGGSFYFEANDHKETPYDILAPLINEGLSKTEVAVTRIAFANHDTVKFEELEWVKDSLSDQETEWTKPIYNYKELQGDFSLEDINISTERWRIGFLSFDKANGAFLRINIYDEQETLVASEEFEFGVEYEYTNHGDIHIDQSGKFSVEVITDEDFEYQIYINEQRN